MVLIPMPFRWVNDFGRIQFNLGLEAREDFVEDSRQ
jgi:hypothetical protein